MVDGTPFGRYVLVQLLGRGGMGEVWRAYDTAANNRTVAIKLLPGHVAGDSTFVQRFRREADAAAQLSNPHIIPIHNYGEIDGRLYVDMRLIEGRDLQQMLNAGPLDPARAVRIVEQVAKALQAAHKVGLVHRDVKPSNILIDDDDFAYLIDFGIARGTDQTGITGTGSMIGSWHYMAPERFRANEVGGAPDARVDIYSLACVLYECLTGGHPFPGDTLESQIAAHSTNPPPRPSLSRSGLPAHLDAVIARGMSKDPADRYQSTQELALAAQAALAASTEPRWDARPVIDEQPQVLGAVPAEHAPAYWAAVPGPQTLAPNNFGVGNAPPWHPTGTPPYGQLPPNQFAPAPQAPAPQGMSPVFKILLGVGTLLAVVIIAAVVIVVANKSPSGRGSASTSSTPYGSTTTVRTTTPTVTVSGPPNQKLLAMVPAAENCSPYTPIGATGATAEVDCHPASSSVTRLRYYLFGDLSALRAWLNERAVGQEPCPGTTQLEPQPWHSAKNPDESGTVICFNYEGPTVSWSDESRLLSGLVIGATLQDAYQWFTNRYK